MSVKTLMISIFLVSAIIIGFAGFQSELLGNYGINANTSNYTFINRTDSFYDKLESIYSRYNQTDEPAITSGAGSYMYFVSEGLLNAGSTAVLLLISTPDLFNTIVYTFATALNLPPFIAGTIMGLVFLAFAIFVIEMILRTRVY